MNIPRFEGGPLDGLETLAVQTGATTVEVATRSSIKNGTHYIAHTYRLDPERNTFVHVWAREVHPDES